MRGPSDVVNSILSSVSPAYAKNPEADPTFSCSTPHTLAFQIGGKTFPIDPLDFLRQSTSPAPRDCTASNIVATDPPGVGATFSWSLGDPFFKSTLVAFYYGNLTHPSVDPPRVGFMSTVGSNTSAELSQALSDAQNDGGTFEGKSLIPCGPRLVIDSGSIATVEVAPSASAAVTTVNPTDTVVAAAATSAPASASSSTSSQVPHVTLTSTASTASTTSKSTSSAAAIRLRTTDAGAWIAIALTMLSMLSYAF
jgi:hypothetical protein